MVSVSKIDQRRTNKKAEYPDMTPRWARKRLTERHSGQG